jgi:hypothetical protein
MPLKLLKFATLADANLALSAALVGGRVDRSIGGLVGETLSFAEPAGSCTFTEVSGGPAGVLSLEDVRLQLEAQVTDLRVELDSGRIIFRRATPGENVVLFAANEVARSLLGFANNAELKSQFLNPPDGPAPRVIDIEPVESGSVYLLIEE